MEPGPSRRVDRLLGPAQPRQRPARCVGIEGVVDPAIADPMNPMLLGELDGNYAAVFASGARAYTESFTLGKPIYDVSNPAAIAPIGSIEIPGDEVRDEIAIDTRTIAVLGPEGDQGGIRTADVTDLSAPITAVLGSWQTRPGVLIGNVLAIGNRLVVAMHQDGVRVVDLTDPAAPVEVAHRQTWDAFDAGWNPYEGVHRVDVDAVTGRVYALDRVGGLSGIKLMAFSID